MYGRTMGSLTVYLDNEEGRQHVWEIKGNQGNKWIKATVPILSKSSFKVSAHAFGKEETI